MNIALLQTFLINGTIMLLFIFWGIKIISRKRTRTSITLAGVFLVPALGLFVNILYRAINIESFNIIGNKLTITLTTFGLFNLLIFNLIMLKSQKAFTLKKQIIYVLIYIIFLSVLFLIKDGVTWDYDKSDPNDTGVPVWSILFGIYGIVISQTVTVFVIITGRRLSKDMDSSTSKYSKKFIQSIVGVLLMDLVLLGNFIFNTLNDPTGRIILLVMSACIIPAGYFLYSGLKQEN